MNYENIGPLIRKLRSERGLTQNEVAEKLHISNKAVSKWERGESVPDLYVLKQLADFYGITIDTLISEPTNKVSIIDKLRGKIRQIIAICSTMLVWLVAICAFVFINNIFPSITRTWMAFIYALPITCIVLLVLTSVWNKKITSAIIVSCLVWTALLSVFLTLTFLLPPTAKNLWQIFLIGIPLQVLTIFWSIFFSAFFDFLTTSLFYFPNISFKPDSTN